MNFALSEKYPAKRAFVTGAGSGLGRALSLQLAGDGWTIGITDIHEKELKATAAAIHAKGGKSVLYIFDVSDKTAFEQALTDFEQKNNGIDLMVNNAGVGDGGLFDEYSLENWDWILGINLKGVIYGAHYAAAIMKKQQSGHIINIASAAAFANAPNMSMYNVPKAGVLSLSESIQPELKFYKVGVSVVMPLFFQTNIMQFHRGDDVSKKIGQEYINKSGISADVVANAILQAAGKNKFYIYYPFSSWAIAFFKRLFPMLFLHLKFLLFKKKRING